MNVWSSLALNLVLVAALVWSVVTDLRWRRIGNRLTYPLMVLGLVANGIADGWDGLRLSALGWALGAAILLLPCLLGAVGGGDVKLMAAIGALKGPQFVLFVAFYSALAGGLLAIAELIRTRGVRRTLGYLSGGWLGSVRGTAPPAGAIPYGPAIAVGALLALVHLTPLAR